MKRIKLDKLRKKVINDLYIKKWIEVWFFPEYNKVKGFLGTQNIMFVGLNPSYSCFPTKVDKFFYEQLKKYGFENAHLTDLIKIRTKNENIHKILGDKQVLMEQIRFLIKEIEIINPKVIIALGKKCYDALRNNLKKKNIKIIQLIHYSSTRFPKNKIKFFNEIKKIRKKYGKRQKNEK